MHCIEYGNPAGHHGPFTRLQWLRRCVQCRQQQRIQANVYFANGIIGRIGVVVHNSDLQWFILQISIVNLQQNKKEKKLIHRDHHVSHLSCPGRLRTSKRNQSEFHCGCNDFRYTSVLQVIEPNLISTYASVVSLLRSMTGKFRPANIFTRTFPGIFTFCTLFFFFFSFFL